MTTANAIRRRRELGMAPMLEAGDHMRADEFFRRYEEMPNLKKAELLRGIVYLQTSVRHALHGEPHADIVGWLGMYRTLTKGIRCGDNCTVLLDDMNVAQPDALMFIPAEAGGQSIISDAGFVAGAPELVVEVATSSRSLELGVKRDVWLEFGAREYLVWRVADEAIDWFALRGNRFVQIEPEQDEIIRSLTFPGLWLDWQALLTDNLARVFAVLQQGAATPEHQAFVERLQQATESKSP
jgi:Uma2 family endonuclease